jgi:dynein heavy chain
MNHKSGSFIVDPRLQRHFTTFACQMPGDADLTTIFGSILTGHFFNFDKKIQGMAKNLTDAIINLQKEMISKFLPSAIKFHYNFTMRDLSAIVKGLLNSRSKEYTSSVQITRLWYHECMRVFSDRLISDTEVSRCREITINIGKRFMDDDPEIAYAEPCNFTNFVTNPDELSTYVACENFTKLKDALGKKLAEYNESFAIMNLVF